MTVATRYSLKLTNLFIFPLMLMLVAVIAHVRVNGPEFACNSLFLSFEFRIPDLTELMAFLANNLFMLTIEFVAVVVRRVMLECEVFPLVI